MTAEHFVLVLWLLVGGMMGCLVGAGFPVFGDVMKNRVGEGGGVEWTLAISMGFLIMLGIAVFVGGAIQAKAGGSGIVAFLATIITLFFGCWIFILMEARSSWSSPKDIDVLRAMGRFTPNLAAFTLWGLRVTNVKEKFYQDALADLGRMGPAPRSWWFRRQMLKYGEVSSWRVLLGRGQKDTWNSLQKLIEHNRDFAYTLVVNACRDDREWPQQDTRKLARWMIQQPDPQVREAGLRIAGQVE